MQNLFDDIPTNLNEELLQTLAQTDGVRIERIVSNGQASAEGFWYDQDQAEFVVVIQGAARLQLLEPDEVIEMKAGDFINIDAHRKHRVDWTDTDQPTIWLAIHYRD